MELDRHSLPIVPVVSPSVAAVPQEAIGRSGKSSAPPILSAILRADIESLKYALQPSEAHRRHRVFPVPVGLSSTPFTFYDKEITHAAFNLTTPLTASNRREVG